MDTKENLAKKANSTRAIQGGGGGSRLLNCVPKHITGVVWIKGSNYSFCGKVKHTQ